MRRWWMIAAALAVASPALGWELTPANIGITDVPEIGDFVPIGVVYELGEDGSLGYTPDPAWVQSCFILVAAGRTEEGVPFLFQGRLPFEGAFAPKIYLGGAGTSSPPSGGRSITRHPGERPPCTSSTPPAAIANP